MSRTDTPVPGGPSPAAARCGRPRAVAFDYDGTLTEGPRPADPTLDAIGRARLVGLVTILVTGRILEELVADFPEVADHFDALVLENGAEVTVAGHPVPTVLPLDPSLSRSLSAAGIPHRNGHLILATSAAAEHTIVDAVNDLGLECQLIHNRGELMVVPSGVSKGTGLAAALAELGISPHDCVAVGDAENDHSLLAAAELGVAVANAVDALKDHADVVLDAPDGDGVLALLDDLTGECRLWDHRGGPRITIGEDDEGRPVGLPARPGNVLITGGSGAGKSYLAGLVAEQLVGLEYSVLVIDPEGDHVGLDALRRAVVVGADHPPPSVDIVVGLLKRSDACVVVDLSALGPDERDRYLDDLPAEVEASRRAVGRPHWVFFDEAHRTTAPGSAQRAMEPAARGYCLVTWRPGELAGPLVAGIDTILVLTSPAPEEDIVDLVAAVAHQPKELVARLLDGPQGRVVVVDRDRPGPPLLARLAPRTTPHLRHEHKYDVIGTPSNRAFWFRDEHDRPTGAVAHNLAELEVELSRCGRGVVRHHAPLHDFSRWIVNVFHDRSLGAAVRAVEAVVTAESPAAVIDGARLDLIHRIGSRRRPSHPPAGT